MANGQLRVGIGSFLEELNQTIDDNIDTPSETLLESITKPKYEIPGLSHYSRTIGKISKILDAPVEKRKKTFRELGVSMVHDPTSGMSFPSVVEPDSPLAGEKGSPMPSTTLAMLAPLSGDPETGKYSDVDLAFGVADVLGVGAQLYEMPKIRELQEKVAKELGIKNPPSVLEFQREEVMKMIKEGIIKEETIKSARWNIDNLGFDEIEKLKLIYPNAQDRLSDAAHASKYAKESEMISRGIQDEVMEYTIHGKTKREVDIFVQMARDPKTTAKDMSKLGFEKEYKGYLKYKKDIEKRMGKIKKGDFKYVTRGVEAPDIRYTEGLMRSVDENIMGMADRMELARNPKYGFMDVGEGAAGYYRPQVIVSEKDYIRPRTKIPGVYREKVVVDAGILNQDELASVAVHEFQHYLTRGIEDIPRVVKTELADLLRGRGDWDKLIEFWKKNDLRVKKLDGTGSTTALKSNNDEIALTIEYFIKSTEMQARMQQIRKALKVSPGKKITTKQVDELLSSSDVRTQSAIEDLLNVMKNKKSLLKALNTLPALVPVTLEENLFNEWDGEDNIF